MTKVERLRYFPGTMSSEFMKGQVGVALRRGGDESVVEKRNSLIFAAFGGVMMVTALVMPLISADQEMRPWLTALQVVLWLFFCLTWVYQGYLLERAGVGFGHRKSGMEPVIGIRWREISLYLLVYGPLCFGYIYVTYLNTGYFGFNYVLLFVVAGFATLIFPFLVAVVYLIYQWLAWLVLAHLMWGGWWEVVDSVTMLAGFFFSAMMFYIFRRERMSRDRALALSAKLDEANEKLRSYSQQVEELSATQERNRIAREIHDTIGHSLTVVNMQLETAKALIGTDSEKALEFVEKAQEVTKKGLGDIRTSVASLRSSPLDGRPLAQALEALVGASLGTQVEVVFEVKGEAVALRSATEAALYRSLQEALTNVRKHANASHVRVELDFGVEEVVRLLVRDDGNGCSKVEGGFGIMGIRERVQLLGGTVELSSSPGEGLAVSIQVPR